MSTYLVMADAFIYVEADSPEEAEETAESMDMGDWDIQNFSSQDKPEDI
jgi:hypothetical protein